VKAYTFIREQVTKLDDSVHCNNNSRRREIAKTVDNTMGDFRDLMAVDAKLSDIQINDIHLSELTLRCVIDYRSSVGLSVCLVGELWKNGGWDLDVVWGGEWGRSRDE